MLNGAALHSTSFSHHRPLISPYSTLRWIRSWHHRLLNLRLVLADSIQLHSVQCAVSDVETGFFLIFRFRGLTLIRTYSTPILYLQGTVGSSTFLPRFGVGFEPMGTSLRNGDQLCYGEGINPRHILYFLISMKFHLAKAALSAPTSRIDSWRLYWAKNKVIFAQNCILRLTTLSKYSILRSP